jgi:hypothetical protein
MYGMKEFTRDLFTIITHPDHEKGSWRVHFRGRVKPCKNIETAKSWAFYFRRNFVDGWTSSISRIDKKTPSELLDQ